MKNDYLLRLREGFDILDISVLSGKLISIWQAIDRAQEENVNIIAFKMDSFHACK